MKNCKNYAIVVFVSFIFTGITISTSGQSKTTVSPLEGPVQFIRDYQYKSSTEEGKDYVYQYTKPIAVKAGDRLYMRIKDHDRHFARLFLTKYSPMKNYVNAYDSIRGEVIRWYHFDKDDTVKVWGETKASFDGYMEVEEPDANDNYGLYVMHYVNANEHYSEDAPLADRLQYVLNQFYADGAFAAQQILDTSGREDVYLMNFTIKKGYLPIIAFRKKPFAITCERFGFYSPDMTKEAARAELDKWKEAFKTIENASYSNGGNVDGLTALSYIIPVQKDLCKFPARAICEGALSEAPGRINIRITPVIKNGKYLLEILIVAI